MPFIQSDRQSFLDATETWMLYHATDDPNSNESSTRIARADKITWAEDHAPIFPRPTNQRKPVPSGQTRFLSEQSVGTSHKFTLYVLLICVMVLLSRNK